MIDREDAPKPNPAHIIGQDLAPLSIDDLLARIPLLRAEIERVELAIAQKRQSQNAAAAIFSIKRTEM
jgi:uncharacterized small protein (DUF1192 family)